MWTSQDLCLRLLLSKPSQPDSTHPSARSHPPTSQASPTQQSTHLPDRLKRQLHKQRLGAALLVALGPGTKSNAAYVQSTHTKADLAADRKNNANYSKWLLLRTLMRTMRLVLGWYAKSPHSARCSADALHPILAAAAGAAEGGVNAGKLAQLRGNANMAAAGM